MQGMSGRWLSDLRAREGEVQLQTVRRLCHLRARAPAMPVRKVRVRQTQGQARPGVTAASNHPAPPGVRARSVQGGGFWSTKARGSNH